jgi:cytochrome b subunit of formate dehydrogenase
MPTPTRVLRFTFSEWAFHWLVAAAFFSMLLSGFLMGAQVSLATRGGGGTPGGLGTAGRSALHVWVG